MKRIVGKVLAVTMCSSMILASMVVFAFTTDTNVVAHQEAAI